MKRSEAILLLAKEISDLRERKSVLETELRQVNERIKDAGARFRLLVPNADDPVGDEQSKGPIVEGSLVRTIIALMQREPARSWSVDDVLALCPEGTKLGTLRSSMSRLKLRGQLEKADHGKYRLPNSGGGVAGQTLAPSTPTETPETGEKPAEKGGDEDVEF